MAITQKTLIPMLGMGDRMLEINRVMPEFTATATDIALGYEFGVFANYGQKFDYSLLENGIRIQSGAAWAYGYTGYSTGDIDFTLTKPASGVRYMFIFAEFDLSGAAVDGTTVDACHIVCFDNGASANYDFQRDNLREQRNGKYQMPIYRIAVSPAGVTGNNVEDMREIRESVKHADEATMAENVAKAVMAGAVIKAGATIESGVIAVKQAKGNRSTNVATTSYVMEAIDDVKNITSSIISVASGFNADINSVRRQVNFVIGTLSANAPIGSNNIPSASVSTNGTIGTLPSGFLPKATIAVYGKGIVVYFKDRGNIVEGCGIELEINTSGQIKIKSSTCTASTPLSFTNCKFNFGYEITA